MRWPVVFGWFAAVLAAFVLMAAAVGRMLARRRPRVVAVELDGTGTAICHLCDPNAVVASEDLLGHIRELHDPDFEVATWPDGEPVVLDLTLEPEDFDVDR